MILAVGYGVYFTTWTHLRPDMKSLTFDLSGLLLLLSVVVFIGWEIYQMIATAHFFRSVIKAVVQAYGGDIGLIDLEYKRHAELFASRLASAWVGVLYLTIVPAVVGVGLLLAMYVKHLYAQCA